MLTPAPNLLIDLDFPNSAVKLKEQFQTHQFILIAVIPASGLLFFAALTQSLAALHPPTRCLCTAPDPHIHIQSPSHQTLLTQLHTWFLFPYYQFLDGCAFHVLLLFMLNTPVLSNLHVTCKPDPACLPACLLGFVFLIQPLFCLCLPACLRLVSTAAASNCTTHNKESEHVCQNTVILPDAFTQVPMQTFTLIILMGASVTVNTLCHTAYWGKWYQGNYDGASTTVARYFSSCSHKACQSWINTVQYTGVI